jgi:glyoxylase-like metal-dependent hydrolase (beta-lactamase superfamily II)
LEAGGPVPVDQGTITVTGTAQQAAWRERVLPPVERVRPGLWSLATPFPQSPLRYVLSYLIEDSGGPVLVDTGWPGDAAWDGLVAGVGAAGYDITEIKAVLVTHFHADHSGLAGRVREASGAWIGMHELDAAALRQYSTFAEFAAASADWLEHRGMPRAETAEMLSMGADRMRGLDYPDVLIADGTRPLGERGSLRAIWTPGHTPGHLCFAHEEYDLLLTGDHVLPRITPNISPSPWNTDDVLGQYLASLDVLGDAGDSGPAEVLPAHEYRFSGLSARIGQLKEHHDRWLGVVLDIVGADDGCSSVDVAARLTWSRPWEQNRGIVRRSAIGETYAHLVHLERRGLIANTPGGPGGADGADAPDQWHLTG